VDHPADRKSRSGSRGALRLRHSLGRKKSFRGQGARLRYNYVPDHLIGEVLTKRWADNAIPFLALVITVVGFGTAISGFFKPQSLSDSTRQLGEFSIVVTGLTIVMLGGGIDLSVGSIFALACFSAAGTF